MSEASERARQVRLMAFDVDGVLTDGRLYLDDIVPWMSRVCSGSQEAKRLVHYCWDSLENLVPPATITSSMMACGFDDARGVARFGLLSEYVGHKPSARST